MTDSLLRRGQYSLAPAQRRDVAEGLALCALDPVTNVVPAMHLETASRAGVIPSGLWVVRKRGRISRELAGVIWCGANLTAVLPTADDYDADDARAEVASSIISRLSRPAALVGEADLTLDLWGRVEPWWGPARQLRPSQVSMSIKGHPRPVVDADYGALLPAARHFRPL